MTAVKIIFLIVMTLSFSFHSSAASNYQKIYCQNIPHLLFLLKAAGTLREKEVGAINERHKLAGYSGPGFTMIRNQEIEKARLQLSYFSCQDPSFLENLMHLLKSRKSIKMYNLCLKLKHTRDGNDYLSATYADIGIKSKSTWKETYTDSLEKLCSAASERNENQCQKHSFSIHFLHPKLRYKDTDPLELCKKIVDDVNNFLKQIRIINKKDKS